MTELTKSEYKKGKYMMVSLLILFISIFIMSLGLTNFDILKTIQISVFIYGSIGIILGVITFLGTIIMEDEEFE